MVEDSGRPRKRARQSQREESDDEIIEDEGYASGGSEVVEDLFTLDGGWSVEVLGEEDSKLYDLEVRISAAPLTCTCLPCAS